MSSITELNAIKTAWDAASLDGTFAGGIWAYKAPATAFPYVVVSSIGRAAIDFSSSRRVDAETIQLSIFAKPDRGTDPVGEMDTLTKALTAVFDDATLSLDADVTQLSMRFQSAILLQEDDEVYQCAITYELQVATA